MSTWVEVCLHECVHLVHLHLITAGVIRGCFCHMRAFTLSLLFKLLFLEQFFWVKLNFRHDGDSDSLFYNPEGAKTACGMFSIDRKNNWVEPTMSQCGIRCQMNGLGRECSWVQRKDQLGSAGLSGEWAGKATCWGAGYCRDKGSWGARCWGARCWGTWGFCRGSKASLCQR